MNVKKAQMRMEYFLNDASPRNYLLPNIDKSHLEVFFELSSYIIMKKIWWYRINQRCFCSVGNFFGNDLSAPEFIVYPPFAFKSKHSKIVLWPANYSTMMMLKVSLLISQKREISKHPVLLKCEILRWHQKDFRKFERNRTPIAQWDGIMILV